MTRPDNTRFAAGVDIGGSHVSSTVVDLLTGELMSSPLSTPVDCTAPATEILDAWARNIRQTVATSALPVGQVGMAFPGPFDYERGISLIDGVQKFDRIWGLDVAASLRDRLTGCGCGPLRLRFVNDAAAFALGECLGGATRDAERVVALTLGTGVGSGFVADRRLVERGDTVPAHGWVYHLPFEDGIADDAFSTRWFRRRWHYLTGETIDGARDAARRAEEGDTTARRLFEEYGTRLGAFAAPLVERFGGRTLLLGGNIARAWELFGPALEERLAVAGCRAEVRRSALLDRAAMIGAASLFL
ncbi:ROK family protein [uncultured Alistipes sp.]|uniref:ROK family protein n=1 Tax=uncultured Alistipes sp. TaxID=538949 RepID=UPI00260DDF95|nr:ROK family protein [uncultured Alistipes sp.]